jgi:hypothetical protein
MYKMPYLLSQTHLELGFMPSQTNVIVYSDENFVTTSNNWTARLTSLLTVIFGRLFTTLKYKL